MIADHDMQFQAFCRVRTRLSETEDFVETRIGLHDGTRLFAEEDLHARNEFQFVVHGQIKDANLGATSHWPVGRRSGERRVGKEC